MKLIIFLIIVVIIYFIATQIKVVHITTLPTKERTELENKNKLKEMLKPSYIKSFENKENTIPQQENFQKQIKNTKEQNSDSLLSIIRSNHLDPNYQFNIANSPINLMNLHKDNMHYDKYKKYITKEINSWKKIYKNNFQVFNIEPIYIAETLDEFLVKANANINFYGKSLFVQVVYYGMVERSDDPFNTCDKYKLQLVGIKKISRSEYSTITKIDNPFMTMNEQMEYIAKINQMHAEEFD